MKTARFERACCWPMNSLSRCGRNEESTLSSSRRSAVSRRAVALDPAGEINRSSQCALPAVLVRQELADRRNGGTVCRRHDDAGVSIVIPNQLAAAAAWRYDRDRLIGFLRPRVTDPHAGPPSALPPPPYP